MTGTDSFPDPLRGMRAQHIYDMTSQQPVGVEVFAASADHNGEQWHHASKEDVDRAFVATLEYLTNTIPLLGTSLSFVSVNVDPVSVSVEHTPAVLAALSAFGRCGLVLEVLETSVLGAEQLAVLKQWAVSGALLVVDDYGSVHADEQRLDQHSWFGVKLARSMVVKMASDPSTTAEAASLTDRYMYVVAEGIETEDESDAAQAAGVTLAQGWLYHRPEPVSAGTIDGVMRSLR